MKETIINIIMRAKKNLMLGRKALEREKNSFVKLGN